MFIIYSIVAFLLSALAAFFVYRADKRKAVPMPWLTAGLRGLVVLLTLLLLLIPSLSIIKNNVEQPVVVFLQDNSMSVGNALGGEASKYEQNANKMLDKLASKYKVIKWGFGNTIQKDTVFQYKQSETDIAAALTEVQDFYGLRNLGAIVVASDGKFNKGENPVYAQTGIHAPVYSVVLGDSTEQKDLRIAQTYHNKVVAEHNSFEIRADIIGSLCSGYDNTVTLKENSNVVGSVPLIINGNKFDKTIAFSLTAASIGMHHYVIELPVADGEKNTANNRKDIYVEIVNERKNVLIASDAPHPDVNAIREALQGLDNFEISVATGDNFPSDLSKFNVIILHGLPSNRNDIAGKVLASGKPVWFIVGANTKIPALNSMTALTNTSVGPGGLHDLSVNFNSHFNSFTLPKQIQTVTDKLPPLNSTVSNLIAPPGTNSLFTQSTGVGNMQSAVWLMVQAKVPVAFLAGEGLWRWRVYEFKNFNSHEVIDECIRQTVSFLAANTHEKPFTVAMPKYVWRDREPISVKAFLLNPAKEFVNTPDATISIIDSAGTKRDFTLERTGNDYSLNLGIWAGGAYSYVAKTKFNEKEYTTTGSFAVETIPAELSEQGADYPLMFGLSKKYGGSFHTQNNVEAVYDSIVANTNIKPLIQSNVENLPFVERKWFFFLILLLAVTEWLLRKYWMAM